MMTVGTTEARPGVAEILAVGNELLNGSVQDGNSYRLITWVMELGGVVGRVSILPDVEELIAQEVRAVLGRPPGHAPDILFVTGGLGPTMDDLTVAAVARGLDLPLEMHEQAREMIRASYDHLAARGVIEQGGLNPAREKMALLPRGATALVNPTGTAPGVLLELESLTIVCFPGVPGEMESIFKESLQPVLRRVFPEMVFVQHRLWVQCNDESILAPHLQWFQENYPAIHVKARSGMFKENPELEFIFSLGGADRQGVTTSLEQALGVLTQRLRNHALHLSRGD